MKKLIIFVILTGATLPLFAEEMSKDYISSFINESLNLEKKSKFSSSSFLAPKSNKKNAFRIQPVERTSTKFIPFLKETFIKNEKGKIWPRIIIASTMQAVAGYFYGEAEILLPNDYDKYVARWPHTNRNWTDTRISSRRKYKNYPSDLSPKFWGSKTVFVGVTDKYHLDHLIGNVLLAASVGIYYSIGSNESFKKVLVKSLLYSGLSWSSFALGTGVAHAFYRNN